eukprot:CAMPEP_0170266964 /NCGR_PEP_ID=MMETSP0116_2-20130129/33404_1 /TAXON_ID=400756 /ORGANISM="Durinskia baltica, Strain CSIRO CS-38" /LENGTH=556 /DNA_ID=CAMNT_0010518111 /DNA_START=292 /DNA_END=1962 /DNA_ORIENTATION=-
MMISDTTFWGNSDVEADAILQEKDTFYILSTVTPQERRVFWPNNNSLTHPDNPKEDAHNDIKQALEIIKSENGQSGGESAPSADMANSPRIKRWIDSWSGGLALDILLLRAYCNMHQMDERVPHVYPLRVLGVLPNQANFTAPCPYWSCLLTEARPKGKLVFFMTIAAAGVLNWLHWRFDCMSCETLRWWLGAGAPRQFWWWFWAALLPLCSVMAIKTTYDEELGVVIWQRWHAFIDPIWSFAFDTVDKEGNPIDANGHKIQLVLFIAVVFVAWIYRHRIRRELGLDEHSLLPFLMARHEIAEESRHTFQVCIWRVDLTGDAPAPAAASPRADSVESAEGSDPEQPEDVSRRMPDTRSLMLCGSPSRTRHGRSWMQKLYTPMFRRTEHANVLSTADGRIPTLSVHFYYGMDEVQGTRTIKPSQDQWWNHDPVYFQENFKISVEWRPNTMLRCEVRDSSATLGSVSLGSVSFDESSIERQFHRSNNANPQVRRHSVPIMQVVQMSALPPTSQNQEDQQIIQLKSLGFEQHRLTDGGAVWLAFYEHDDAAMNETPLCC